MQRILVADDDASLREALNDLLTDEGFDVRVTSNGDGVLAAFADGSDDLPDLVLMDVRMPGKSGLDVLRELKQTRPAPLPVIVMTAFATANVAIEAIQLGAYDYVTKPYSFEDLLVTIGRFLDWQALNTQVDELSTRLVQSDPSDAIIGTSAPMLEVYKVIGRVARSDATVLITGETGTGKELVATVIHRNSGYARGPLVKVNCAALPETLLESELFGHEKGAFTGAIAQRKGRFEMANKGSIFLDEIGEMTLATQKKLLRVLQEREFERVGGSATVKVDTRVIAATNKHLPSEISEGHFREDLYYRLNVISIHLPALRERSEDIPLLIEHFLHKHRYTLNADPARISNGALAELVGYAWPGNVRELENVIERAVILAQGGIIAEEHIDFSRSMQRPAIDVSQRLREGATLQALHHEVDRIAVAEAIAQHQGDHVAAAEALGIPLADLETRVSQLGLAAR